MALAHRETSVASHKDNGEAKRTPRLPLSSLLIGALTFIGMMISIWMIFLYAPSDVVQGDAQRIFYVHVPIAWVGMLAFIVLAIASIVYLVRPRTHWDWIARASAEIGTVFITLALLTGSIWGKTTWGTWWSWDPQLTATLILWFMYVAYLMLRNYMGRTHTSARSAAVLAIVGVIDVPIIYEAANWWRTLHPPKEVGVAGALPPAVVLTLMVSLVTFTLLYCFLMLQIYQLQRAQTLAQRLRTLVEE